MAINFSAAGKTALVIAALWGLMYGGQIVSQSAAMMAPARDVGLSLANAADGVIVGAVAPGSVAAKAGVKPGDVIVGVGGTQIHNLEDYLFRVGRLDKGETLSFVVSRNGAMPKRYVMGTDAAEIAAKEAAARSAPSPIGVRQTTRLGISLQDLQPGQRPDGAPMAPQVVSIEPGSLAEAAGLREGDYIEAVDKVKVNSQLDVAAKVQGGMPARLLLAVWRAGERKNIEVVRDVVEAVSYTHLRAHEKDSYLVCRL